MNRTELAAVWPPTAAVWPPTAAVWPPTAAVWPPTAAVAAAAGHEPTRPLEAIRQKCLDCSGGHVKDVRTCELVACPLWPFRAGRNPYRKSPAIRGVFPKRAAGGTWTASEASLKKAPAIDGGFSECGHSERSLSTPPAETPASPLLQALSGEPAAGGTGRPAEGASWKNPLQQASGEECGHSGATPSNTDG